MKKIQKNHSQFACQPEDLLLDEDFQRAYLAWSSPLKSAMSRTHIASKSKKTYRAHNLW